ncbi:MAG: EboA domain-containing protein [Bacteroidota bacterium]
MQTLIKVDIQPIRTFLRKLISRSSTPKAMQWLDEEIGKMNSERWEHSAYRTFSMIPRMVGKTEVQLNSQDSQTANELRSGWTISGWTIDRFARVYVILSLPIENFPLYVKTLNALFSAADVSELVALYSALPLLPHPEEFRLRAAEGIRTNMTVVFDAIALQNPYPADYLDESAWNQMTLKAVFIGRPLYKIYGLDRRNNLHLARMLSDYAHERWAANRTVTPEVWRLIAPFLTTGEDRFLSDLKRVINDSDHIQQEAAALAIYQSKAPSAQSLLAAKKDLQPRISANTITWQSIAEQWHAGK